MRSGNVNEACNKLIGMKPDIKCTYYKSLRENVKNSISKVIKTLPKSWDIEDLVSVGKDKRLCPYYFAREYHHYAELVICPYNYLIDEIIKTSVIIEFKQ